MHNLYQELLVMFCRWQIVLAGLRSGIVIAPATTQVTSSEIVYRCNKAMAKVFVGDAHSVRKVLEVRDECPSLRTILSIDDERDPRITNLHDLLRRIPEGVNYNALRLPWSAPSMLYFTSGTSGPPKMVQHNQVSYPLGKALTVSSIIIG